MAEPYGSIEHQVLTTYDGTGRVVTQQLMVHHSGHSRRTTGYGDDRVHVTPPEGGTATTEMTDARGNLVELRQYHGA